MSKISEQSPEVNESKPKQDFNQRAIKFKMNTSQLK